ncbi:MAG: hypothetical protein K0R84_743 [Clostridia bacterium]|nr:hypothetical protein [Clostridia bacterium]
MRPRYLEIEGLQSFKESQRIDFDRLSETGLFGIFGPTGSGKSTILDAITLALYGSVQRAKGTQGIINTDMSNIKVIFIFDLTKEGSRRTYRIERLYKRKKDTDNSIEAKVTRLIEITDAGEQILADKHSDVNNCVIQLLGLRFEDFTRSVVLPQNKFQEFLLSPRGEKTKMLERIFYLEEYGRQLGDKVSRQMAAIKNRLSNLEGALSSLGNASPEALIESERKLQEAQISKDRCFEDQKKVEQGYTEGMELYKLSNEYLAAKQQLQEHEERQGEIDKLKEKCQRAEAASGIKALMDTYKESKEGFEEAAKGLNSANGQLQVLETEKVSAQQVYEAARENKEKKLPELIKYKTILQQCQVLDREAKELEGHLEKARKEYTGIKEQIETAQRTAKEKTEKRESLNTVLQELEKKLEELTVDNEHRRLVSQGSDLEKELENFCQNQKKYIDKIKEINTDIEKNEKQHGIELSAIKQCNDAIERLNEQEKQLEASRPMDRQQVLEQQGKVLVYEGTAANIAAASRTIKELEVKLEGQTMQNIQLQQRISELEGSLALLLQQRQLKQEELIKRQQEQNKEAAAILAQELIHGEACPVCGSKDHPNPALHKDNGDTKSIDSEIAELQSQAEVLDKAVRGHEHELIKLREQQKNIEESRLQTEKDIKANKKEYEKQKQTLPEQIRILQEQEINKYIEEEKLKHQAALDKLQQWEQKSQELKAEIKKQESSLSELKVRESRYTALLDSAKAALQQEQKQLEEINHAIEECRDKHKSAAAQLGIQSFAQEAKEILHKDEQSQQLQKTVRLQRGSLDALMLETQGLLEEINKINDALAEKRTEGIKLKEQKDEKEKKVAEILGGKKLEEELKKADMEAQALEENYKTALDKLNKMNESITELQKNKSAFQNSYVYFKEKLETSEQKLQESLKAKGFKDVNEAADSMLTEQMLTVYQEEIKKAERAKGSLEDRLKAISSQLEGKLLTELQWQELCSEYQAAKARLEEHITMLEAARGSYQLVKDNFEKWIKLQEELQAVSKKKDMLEQIQKLLKGNAFIEFISEERMRYIAREAAETLGQLTKFRYSVELDSENGFVIRDNANGGVLRSVATLSGGETFLTSLSLALALSSQLQLKGQSPLEFFFLDEGFGTLDNTLLDTVVDSLERLSSNKRIIGLISHVPELKERIPRRLVVEAPDRVGNGSKVSIEKA